MNSSLIQLLVLAGIAVFLILRLRSVLGTREGYEEPRQEGASQARRKGPDLEVIEGGPDQDILDHAEEGRVNALALAKMKSMEPQFGVNDFLGGARGGHEVSVGGRGEGVSDRDEGRLGSIRLETASSPLIRD